MDRPDQSFFMLIGKTAYILSLTCHIGLYYIISKPSIQTLVFKGEQLSEKKNFYMAIIILLVLTAFAYLFTSISNVISFVGATANLYIVFYMPILLYLAYKPKRDYKRNISIIILVTATILGVVFLVITFLDNFYPLLKT